MRFRPALVAIALVAIALVAAMASPLPARADTLLHADPSAENVTAYGGVLMWSRKDAQGRYHLVQRVGGVVSDAPVPPSALPFDPDLGPRGQSRVAAVYERCRPGFRRCDVHRLDVASGRERRVPAAARRGASEFAASVWRSRYAFARVGAARDGVFTAVGSRKRLLAPRAVIETDVRGRTVAFAAFRPSDAVQVDFTSIWVHHVPRRGRGRSCLVDRAGQGGEEGTALDSPVIDGGHVYWHEFSARPAIVERVRRASLSSACAPRPRVETMIRTLPIGVDTIAVDRGTVYYTQGDYVDAAGVYVADSPPPLFTRL